MRKYQYSLIGKTINGIIILDYANRPNNIKSRDKYYLCKCICGNKKIMSAKSLKAGLFCGASIHRVDNLIGHIFGALTVKKLSHTKKRGAFWLCLCKCGTEKVIEAQDIKKGHTKSCGCLSEFFRKQTCMKRYGVEHNMQDRNIALKNVRSHNNTYIKYHWETKEELICQASWESKVIDYLNSNKIQFKWQHKIFKMPNGKTYRPDLYLIGKKIPWIEIKGYFRKDAKNKWKWFHNKCKPNSELWNESKLKEMGIL